MLNTWIIVAESSRARLFSYHGLKSPLTEFDDLVHSESRLHESELTADLPGRSFDSVGHNRHALEAKNSAKDKQAQLFARQIATYLDAACNDGRLESLIVIAAPRFIGYLRESFTANTRNIISSEISKNLVQMTPEQIRENISEPVPFI
jgi:protein required for attachment to host cells